MKKKYPVAQVRENIQIKKLDISTQLLDKTQTTNIKCWECNSSATLDDNWEAIYKI